MKKILIVILFQIFCVVIMAGVGVRTRHASQSKLADYLGPGKALLHNELPTLRAILRQGLLFQEEKLLL